MSDVAPPASPTIWATLVRVAVFAAAAVVVVTVVTQWNRWTGLAGRQSTDDAFLAADITPLAARVPGYVRSVAVQDYQTVRAGAVLAEIADDDYRAQLAQAEATVAGGNAALAVVRAQRGLQQANIQAAEAVIQATEATLDRARSEAQRQRDLLRTGIAGTRQLVEQADANEKLGTATLAQNRAQLAAAQWQLEILDAQEQQALATLGAQRAMLGIATLNLGYTRITAPADGMVGQRQVRVGQYVAPGSQVMTLVPLPKVWVVANYKETQLTHLQLGQPATITVDSFPGHTLKGHVDSYAPASGAQFSLLPADNATGNFTKVVQRISVKIVLDDPAGLQDRLRPGMSVVSTIDTAAPGIATTSP